MRVLELEVSDFMRLVTAHVEPTGAIVEVAGKNGHGKTSLLNAIQAAIGGGDVLPEQPIRKGQKEAVIRVKLGDDKPTLVVKRTFTAKEEGGYRTELFVEAPDGTFYKKPQTQLDALFGALTFDPFEFTRLKPREQLDQLRTLVPDVDFDAIDAANKRDFDKRTEVNREEKQIQARLAAICVPGDPRQQRIDEAALVAELETAGQRLAEIEKERARREIMIRNSRAEALRAEDIRNGNVEKAKEIARLEERLREMRAELEVDEHRAATTEENAKRLQAEVEALPPLPLPPDTASIRARIEAARRNNGEIDARERALKERTELEDRAKVAKETADKLTAAIKKRNDTKAAAIKAANLPVEGLGFGEDGVLYNGIPFEQASTAEQLRVSVAIAAALSPTLRVALVRDASLLDDDSMALLRDLAEQYGFQLWLERVAADSASGIVLEDGMLKRSNGAEADAA